MMWDYDLLRSIPPNPTKQTVFLRKTRQYSWQHGNAFSSIWIKLDVDQPWPTIDTAQNAAYE